MAIELKEITEDVKIISSLQSLLEREKEGIFTNVIDPPNDSSSSECYAIYKNGHLAGFITVLIYEANEYDKATLEIYRLNILSQFRKKGYGEIAVNQLINIFEQRNINCFAVDITTDNADKLFRKVIGNAFEIIQGDINFRQYTFRRVI